ncbi:MAG: DegT/DnrJ/EryC1/StrS family aminotransferase [Candidatus Aenigmarchaeota archaeon]|nr:DegT/DnrJ/EryC1/StrS family aminotransferase [Candidatus Aenigmarchaeota archaeon]
MVIPIAKPAIGEEEIRAVTEVLKSGNLAQGKKVEQFENDFSRYVGTKFAAAVSSGTSALQIGLQSLGIQKGDEVITSPFTFAATANAIIHCGARPVFADIDSKTFNLDPEKIKVSQRTKAVVCVHLYGQPCEMDSLTKVCRDNKLKLVEDAAQAVGAEYRGRKIGTFGTVSTFSFYATKNLTTGEGGMILTSQKDIAEKSKIIRNQGQTEQYRHEIISYNFRMTDIQAAIGIEQLKKVEYLNKKRAENARFLTDSLSSLNGIETPFVPRHVKHVYHQYTIKVQKGRDSLLNFLNNHGIGARIYYPQPLYLQPPYVKMGFKKGLCPVTEEICRQVLSLPVHPLLSQKELEEIVKNVKDGIRV